MPSGLPDEDKEFLKKGKNYLFGIGIGAYQKVTPKLPNAPKDLEDLAGLLTESYYFERHPDLLLFDDKATRKNIINGLYHLKARVEEDDRLLIYFSGHGDLVGEHGFWIPVDAEDGDFSSYISNVEVRDIIKHIKVRHILLISDSCFSAHLLAHKSADDLKGAYKNWIRDYSRYIFVSGKGRVSDGEKGKNSPFAAALLKHLKQNEEEAINIGLLADMVTKGVNWNYPQKAELKPLYEAGHEGGQFVFLKKQSERDDWQAACRTNTEKAYLDFIDKYPGGQYEAKADEKLAEIAELDAWREALFLDSAHAYRQYLRKYKKGAHAEEAESKLASIRKAEDLKNVEAEKREQELLARLKAEQEEQKRLAQIEAEKKRARQAKIEVDRERQALIEAEKERARMGLPEMIFVKGGPFKMGSNDFDDEKPIHIVTLDDFYIGKYPVTQKEWINIMGSNPSYFKGDQLPVEQVSWDDVQEFLQKLNRKTGKKFRLPTEAEWEYAARGGGKSKGFTYSGSNNLKEVGWYDKNSGNKTHQVGQLAPNELGIHDMSGNVWEWCEDFWHADYKGAPADGSAWLTGGDPSFRVCRGGSWNLSVNLCPVAFRYSSEPAIRIIILGFRVARVD